MSDTDNRKLGIKSILWLAFKIYIIIFLIVLLGWGIHLGWRAYRLVNLAKSLQANGMAIQSTTLVSQVGQAAGDIDAIYRQLSPLFPIFNALQGLPAVGQYLGQVDPWLTYTENLAQAGKDLSVGLAPLLGEPSPSQVNISLPERSSQALVANAARVNSAAQAIERARQARSRMQPELLPGTIRPTFQKLDDNFDLLIAGVQLLKVAPSLLGTQAAQSYLILAQNRDELRATGGFVSGIGLLTLENGEIKEFSLADSYQVDDFSKPYPPPPEPIHRFMLADYWVARDANWSPDFPTSAQAAQNLYTLSTGIHTQGVIAFNQLAIVEVLKVIGAVNVPGTEDPVTAGNVEQYMRQAWAPAPDEGLSADWWAHRKDFMQLLGGMILEKALSLQDQAQVLGLVKALAGLLDQGQVLVYFNDPAAQATLGEAGWDGALKPGSGDYLYLVDSNVGFNKVDSVVQRSLAYRLDLRDLTHPIGELTVSYQHTGTGVLPCKQEVSYGTGTYQDMQQRCYLDYWRIYVPVGSQLSASNARPVPAEQLLNGVGWPGQVENLADEAGAQAFAGLLMLPISTSTQVILSYSLPAGVLSMENESLYSYSLRIDIQPGLEGLPFSFEIILPEHTRLDDPAAGWEALPDQAWVWQASLRQSQEIHLLLRQSGSD